MGPVAIIFMKRGEMVYHNGSRVDGKERCSASTAVNTVPHLVEEWVVRTLRRMVRTLRGIFEGSLMKRIQPQHVGFVCKDNNKDGGRKSCSLQQI